MPKLGEMSEVANELILDQVQESSSDHKDSDQNTGMALSTLLMALLAAFGALMAGITAHEALLDRTEEIMAVSIRESDRLNVAILKTKHDILISQGEEPDAFELAQVQRYERGATEFADQASRDEDKVQSLTLPHLVFSVAVTLLSVGIALGGMAAIIKRDFLWYIGMVLGLVGAIGVVTGITMLIVQ